MFPGNTADPTAFTEIVPVIRDTFALDNLVLVGDRGMITTARITALRELNDGGTDFGWITALRAPQIATLAADDGPLQMSLFDTQDLAEITHPDYPGERLIACRNPLLAAERARKRDDLLAATENLLAPIIARVAAGRLTGADAIGEAVGKVIGKYKMGKHFDRTITDTSLTIERRPRPHRRRSRPRRHLRATHHRARRPARPRRGRHRLQEPRQRRTRLPHHQGRRPGPTAHPPPPRRPRQSPRADLHAGLLPGLAPAPSLGADDIHRRTPTRPGQPGRPRATLHRAPTPKPPPSTTPPATRCAASAAYSITWPPSPATRSATTTGTEVPMLADATADQRRAFNLIGAPIPLTAA